MDLNSQKGYKYAIFKINIGGVYEKKSKEANFRVNKHNTRST